MTPPSFCLADAGQSEWFCSRVGCKIDSDCGTNTVCHFEPGGSACVPAKCGVSGSGNGGAGGAGGAGVGGVSGAGAGNGGTGG